MIKVSDFYSLEDLCAMDEDDMARLLEFYGPDEVPPLESLKASNGNTLAAALDSNKVWSE